MMASDFYDVADLIGDPDFRSAYTLIRGTEIVDDHGRGQSTWEELPAQGIIQPASPRDRERLPEGDRTTEVLAVYSVEPLYMGDDAGQKPDQIRYLGRIYEVRTVEDWHREGPGGYTKGLAVLVRESHAG